MLLQILSLIHYLYQFTLKVKILTKSVNERTSTPKQILFKI